MHMQDNTKKYNIQANKMQSTLIKVQRRYRQSIPARQSNTLNYLLKQIKLITKYDRTSWILWRTAAEDIVQGAVSSYAKSRPIACPT